MKKPTKKRVWLGGAAKTAGGLETRSLSANYRGLCLRTIVVQCCGSRTGNSARDLFVFENISVATSNGFQGRNVKRFSGGFATIRGATSNGFQGDSLFGAAKRQTITPRRGRSTASLFSSE